MLAKARQAFLRVLDNCTLADMVDGEETIEAYRDHFLITPDQLRCKRFAPAAPPGGEDHIEVEGPTALDSKN